MTPACLLETKEAELSRDLAEIQILATESCESLQRALSAVPRGEGCALPSRLHRAHSLATGCQEQSKNPPTDSFLTSFANSHHCLRNKQDTAVCLSN